MVFKKTQWIGWHYYILFKKHTIRACFWDAEWSSVSWSLLKFFSSVHLLVRSKRQCLVRSLVIGSVRFSPQKHPLASRQVWRGVSASHKSCYLTVKEENNWQGSATTSAQALCMPVTIQQRVMTRRIATLLIRHQTQPDTRMHVILSWR